ncbi:MAG: hypothetical protein H6Q76_2674 [Firmicutes bacterium]|nr:hypothetical protein [Bacillota bacterium]
MSSENAGKGIIKRLFGENKTKNSSCCQNIEFEEISQKALAERLGLSLSGAKSRV